MRHRRHSGRNTLTMCRVGHLGPSTVDVNSHRLFELPPVCPVWCRFATRRRLLIAAALSLGLPALPFTHAPPPRPIAAAHPQSLVRSPMERWAPARRPASTPARCSRRRAHPLALQAADCGPRRLVAQIGGSASPLPRANGSIARLWRKCTREGNKNESELKNDTVWEDGSSGWHKRPRSMACCSVRAEQRLREARDRRTEWYLSWTPRRHVVGCHPTVDDARARQYTVPIYANPIWPRRVTDRTGRSRPGRALPV